MTDLLSNLRANPANLANAVLFQLVWLGFVAGAGAGQPWWGLPPLAGLLALSLFTRHWRNDMVWLVVALIFGAYLEWIWIHWQVLDYGTEGAPWWILGLWVGLALTLNHSLSWLRCQPWLAAVLGALVAPLSYRTGEALGAVSISEGLAWVSLAWGLTFLVIFSLQRSPRFDLLEVRL
jgi:hypothetical protein